MRGEKGELWLWLMRHFHQLMSEGGDEECTYIRLVFSYFFLRLFRFLSSVLGGVRLLLVVGCLRWGSILWGCSLEGGSAG